MKIKFWGVRGSIPAPLTSLQIQNKIAAAVQRIEKKDLESAETRELFLSKIPRSLFGTVGGNTTCLEIRLSDDTMLIFDAGSGIRELGNELKKRNAHIRHYHIFLSHFHWDHLHGLPFFTPMAERKAKLTFYSPVDRMEEYIKGQMKFPYFPVPMDVMAANFEFVVLKEAPLKIGTAEISWRKMNHPGGCYSYLVMESGKKVIFSTDTALSDEDFKKTRSNFAYFNGANLLVMDSQYTLGEAIEKYDWGHSSYSLAVDFSAAWDIKNLILFHHEPLYGDTKMHSILKSSGWYLNYIEQKGIKIYLAQEQLELTI
ncbi:MAG: MBL fold metallo-hydrolase [Spirochaetales bacterium]|nr:MBL fold metallo-hydrolase [Spirochaetales bacterium]